MRVRHLIFSILLGGLGRCAGQTPSEVVPALPSVVVAAGAGWNSQAVSPKVGGWITLGVRMSSGGTYSYTTMRTSALGTSTATGLATRLYVTPDGLGSVLGLVDAGATTNNLGGLGLSASSGIVFAYSLNNILKSQGWYVLLDARVGKVTNSGTLNLPVVQPIIMMGVGYSIK